MKKLISISLVFSLFTLLGWHSVGTETHTPASLTEEGSITGGGGGYGGGSSYATGTSITLTAGSGATPGNELDADRAGAGSGGARATDGANGILIIGY